MAYPSRDESSLAVYLREIDQYELLTREQEEALGRRIAQGDREARDEMVRCNLRLVVSVAREFLGTGLPIGDLVAEGNIGLMKAAEGYDPEMGTRFCTYAIWWIRQAIRRALQNTAWTVRVPSYMIELVAKWKRANEKLTARLNRQPTPKEMAEELGISPKRLSVIGRAMRAGVSSAQGSPDMMWLFEGVLVDTRTKSPESQFFEEQEHEMIRQCLAAIDEREAEILRLRFGFGPDEPLTLREIGARLGITRERVRQIEACALRKLAAAFSRAEDGGGPEGDAPADSARMWRAGEPKDGRSSQDNSRKERE